MSNLDYYNGKPLSENTREELLAILRDRDQRWRDDALEAAAQIAERLLGEGEDVSRDIRALKTTPRLPSAP